MLTLAELEKMYEEYSSQPQGTDVQVPRAVALEIFQELVELRKEQEACGEEEK